ncbi:MAG TPA: delta-60 repeat domain-containing protein, partial [Clostridia bacterium]|nr:delta-60 repeat domain-containing protein [Clostridia bacterium]
MKLLELMARLFCLPTSYNYPVNLHRGRFCRSAKLALTLVFTCFALAQSATAQWVSLDPTFPAGSGPDRYVRTLAIQPDGRVLIGGPFTNVNETAVPLLARLNSDGSLDSNFVAQVDQELTGIYPLPSGQILISGSFTKVGSEPRPGLARLNADGTLDSGFVPPTALSPLWSSRLLAGVPAPDGSVFVTGYFTNLGGLPMNRLARLQSDGAVDPAFQSPFYPTNSVTVLTVQPDGKPIVSGGFTNIAGMNVTNLVRLNLDGSVDTTFRSALAPDKQVTRALLQLDGRLLAVVAGWNPVWYSSSPQSLVRLKQDGSLDSSFATQSAISEVIFSGPVVAMALQTNGQILL